MKIEWASNFRSDGSRCRPPPSGMHGWLAKMRGTLLGDEELRSRGMREMREAQYVARRKRQLASRQGFISFFTVGSTSQKISRSSNKKQPHAQITPPSPRRRPTGRRPSDHDLPTPYPRPTGRRSSGYIAAPSPRFTRTTQPPPPPRPTPSRKSSNKTQCPTRVTHPRPRPVLVRIPSWRSMSSNKARRPAQVTQPRSRPVLVRIPSSRSMSSTEAQPPTRRITQPRPRPVLVRISSLSSMSSNKMQRPTRIRPCGRRPGSYQ